MSYTPTFVTPSYNQGQIVEVSYAEWGNLELRLYRDHSDNRQEYSWRQEGECQWRDMTPELERRIWPPERAPLPAREPATLADVAREMGAAAGAAYRERHGVSPWDGEFPEDPACTAELWREDWRVMRSRGVDPVHRAACRRAWESGYYDLP